MDRKGTFYAPNQDWPADAVELEPEALVSLANMNRKARRVYYSELRRGASEADAMQAAADSYKGRRG